jgi:hypothetical protein
VKFREIFRFEFVYQARSVRTWLYFVVLFAIAYLLMRTAGAGVASSIPHTPLPSRLSSPACCRC